MMIWLGLRPAVLGRVLVAAAEAQRVRAPQTTDAKVIPLPDRRKR